MLSCCDSLLGRVNETLIWNQQEKSPLDIALDRLTLARTLMLRQQLIECAARRDLRINPSSCVHLPNTISGHFDEAVQGFQQAARMDYLPRGFIARAEYWSWDHNEQKAEADLREAESIATRCGMRLFQTDAHLLRARIELFRNPAKAGEHLAQARLLIEETGYHRRDRELALLEGKLAEITTKDTKNTKEGPAAGEPPG